MWVESLDVARREEMSGAPLFPFVEAYRRHQRLLCGTHVNSVQEATNREQTDHHRNMMIGEVDRAVVRYEADCSCVERLRTTGYSGELKGALVIRDRNDAAAVKLDPSTGNRHAVLRAYPPGEDGRVLMRKSETIRERRHARCAVGQRE